MSASTFDTTITIGKLDLRLYYVADILDRLVSVAVSCTMRSDATIVYQVYVLCPGSAETIALGMLESHIIGLSKFKFNRSQKYFCNFSFEFVLSFYNLDKG